MTTGCCPPLKNYSSAHTWDHRQSFDQFAVMVVVYLPLHCTVHLFPFLFLFFLLANIPVKIMNCDVSLRTYLAVCSRGGHSPTGGLPNCRCAHFTSLASFWKRFIRHLSNKTPLSTKRCLSFAILYSLWSFIFLLSSFFFLRSSVYFFLLSSLFSLPSEFVSFPSSFSSLLSSLPFHPPTMIFTKYCPYVCCSPPF